MRLALLLLVVCSAVAYADHPSAETFRENGRTALARDDATTALALFEAAQRLGAPPRIKFEIATALLALGRSPEAAQALDEFLLAAIDATEQERSSALLKISELNGQLGRLTIFVKPKDARVTLDGVAKRTGAAVWTVPGAHVLEASHASHPPQRVELVVSAGELRRLELQLERPSRRGLAIGLGVGIGGVVAMTALAVGLGVGITAARGSTPFDSTLPDLRRPQ